MATISGPLKSVTAVLAFEWFALRRLRHSPSDLRGNRRTAASLPPSPRRRKSQLLFCAGDLDQVLTRLFAPLRSLFRRHQAQGLFQSIQIGFKRTAGMGWTSDHVLDGFDKRAPGAGTLRHLCMSRFGQFIDFAGRAGRLRLPPAGDQPLALQRA
jgi:hypothetical protein